MTTAELDALLKIITTLLMGGGAIMAAAYSFISGRSATKAATDTATALTNVAKLTADAQQGQITGLLKQLDFLQKDVIRLNDDVEKLKTERDEDRDALHRLRVDYDALKVQYDTLKAQYDDMKLARDKDAKAITALRTLAQSLQATEEQLRRAQEGIAAS